MYFYLYFSLTSGYFWVSSRELLILKYSEAPESVQGLWNAHFCFFDQVLWLCVTIGAKYCPYTYFKSTYIWKHLQGLCSHIYIMVVWHGGGWGWLLQLGILGTDMDGITSKWKLKTSASDDEKPVVWLLRFLRRQTSYSAFSQDVLLFWLEFPASAGSSCQLSVRFERFS